jgi:hypothetical protein
VIEGKLDEIRLKNLGCLVINLLSHTRADEMMVLIKAGLLMTPNLMILVPSRVDENKLGLMIGMMQTKVIEFHSFS